MHTLDPVSVRMDILREEMAMRVEDRLVPCDSSDSSFQSGADPFQGRVGLAYKKQG